mmetsp:Transcript_19906/g.31865  ORF Transcript_19906/g.31865 Transcript_19906/m.31865 type:complete len:94 (+) Transcript_19906:36-317(+)
MPENIEMIQAAAQLNTRQTIGQPPSTAIFVQLLTVHQQRISKIFRVFKKATDGLRPGCIIECTSSARAMGQEKRIILSSKEGSHWAQIAVDPL